MVLLIVAMLGILIMLSAAVAMLVVKNYLAGVAAASVMSLALSVLFVVLRAPDVALAEAVVGAGLSGVILALTLRKVGLWKIDSSETSADRGEQQS